MLNDSKKKYTAESDNNQVYHQPEKTLNQSHKIDNKNINMLTQYLTALEKLTFYMEEKYGLRIINYSDAVDRAIEIMERK